MLISILLPDLRGGGVERIRIVLAHEFVRAGHEVEFVLMLAQGELLNEAQASFDVVDLGIPRARALPLALIRYMRRRRPEVVLAAMWPLTVIAPVAHRLSGHRCMVLVSEHGMLSAQYRDRGRLHQYLLRLSTSIGYRLARHSVGVSSGLVNDMARLSWSRRDRFHVIHNPVPPRPAPALETINLVETLWDAPQGRRILTVGSMKPVKNHALLLRAFARLRHPDARLMFVGDGQGRDALLLLAYELGVAERVVLAGFHTDPTAFYASADLFVLSSDYEGFGNVIVEAIAAGTAVVSTNCPSGPSEILCGGEFGTLVPVDDEVALAEGMVAALTQPHDRERLRERARVFTPEIAAQKYLDLM
jgi:glycosyltransferase involved in cell wall biosynthesis